MDNLNGISRSRGMPPGIVWTVLLGIVLGLLASVVAIGTSDMVYVFVYEPIVHPRAASPWTVSWSSDTLRYFLLTSVISDLVLAIVVWAPSVLGGALIGLILQRLAAHGRLDSRAVVLVGSLVGLGAGWAAAVLALPAVELGEWQPRADLLWAALVGMGAGLFHSWLLSRWLRKRMT